MTESKITLPPELVQEWRSEPEYGTPGRVTLHTISEQRLFQLLTRAAQWGADQELDACCDWMSECTVGCSNELRAVRRPKPPSLKEQACAALDAYVYGNPDHNDKQNTYNAIRRALEALPDD